VAPFTQGARRVFVVPDGALHLVSFASLPVGDHEYLVESGPLVHYVSAERDLVPSQRAPAAGRGLLALGGPAFDEGSALVMVSSDADARKSPSPASTSTEAAQYRGQHSGCAEFSALKFASLPGSMSEVEEIVSLWRGSARNKSSSSTGPGAGGALAPEVVQLTGASATEAAFKAQASGRRVLHLATHGFFLEGRCPSALESQRGVTVSQDWPSNRTPRTTGDNPLLLSGLALAGANRRNEAAQEQDDGILTAEEIAALDLSGVEWAVLSACDTGVGEIRSSEGVFGLRRAFQVAGAGTLITSMWSVEDEAAREWMRTLYEARFTKGHGTADAAREASLRLLRERRQRGETTHPFYWAGFVAAGEWR
jgi:CHAT domain-containing protein